ncbi:hypothetical protein GALL_395090 [mine drainage metagenome]|uniref:Uncharacterized protein n=1 Tax=mine drainage metagenome TaxID=410659 RepID=A0A1J5Q6G1_9ZZZZ
MRGAVGRAQPGVAEQRPRRVDRLDDDQAAAAVGPRRQRHARKLDGGGHAQPVGAGVPRERGRQRRVALHDQRAAEQLRGVALQRTLQALGEEFDAAQRRGGQQQCAPQQPQLRRAQFAHDVGGGAAELHDVNPAAAAARD